MYGEGNEGEMFMKETQSRMNVLQHLVDSGYEIRSWQNLYARGNSKSLDISVIL